MFHFPRFIISSTFALLASTAMADSCTSWFCSANSLLRGEDAFMALRQEEQSLEQEALANYSGQNPEIIARLHRYRETVQQNSYRQTLRLCWAYRTAAGLETAHGSPSGQIRSMDRKGQTQVYNLEDSLMAWSEIYAHGLYQPVDAITGLKSDYLQVSNLGFFNFEYWFRSMYAMNFVSSTGFLYGAVHCLNTTNSRDIQKFAGAILAVDYEGTLTTEVASGFAIGKLAQLIARPLSRWALRPLHNFFSWLKPLMKKPVLVIAGVPTTIILADNLGCRLIQLEASQKAITAAFDAATNKNEELAQRRHIHIRMNTALKLTRAFIESKKKCDGASSNGDINTCIPEYAPFLQLLQSTGFKDQIEDYRRDQVFAEKERQRSVVESSNPREAQNLYYCTGGTRGDQLPRGKDGATDLQSAYLNMLDFLIPLTESLTQNGKLN